MLTCLPAAVILILGFQALQASNEGTLLQGKILKSRNLEVLNSYRRTRLGMMNLLHFARSKSRSGVETLSVSQACISQVRLLDHSASPLLICSGLEMSQERVADTRMHPGLCDD